jgi:hypothetical protein
MTDVMARIRTMPRRRRLAATAAVANLAVLGTLAAPPAATATPHAPPQIRPLPAAGQESTLDMVAADVPIQVGGRTVTATFNGTLKVRAETSPTDASGSSMALRVVSFDMQADTADLGKVQLTRTAAETTPTGQVELAKHYPLTMKSTLVLDFTLKADRLPSAPSPAGVQQAVPAGPLTLTTKKPAVLTSGTLTEFPPRNASYQLTEPIELVLPGGASAVSATIQQFPAVVTSR